MEEGHGAAAAAVVRRVPAGLLSRRSNMNRMDVNAYVFLALCTRPHTPRSSQPLPFHPRASRTLGYIRNLLIQQAHWQTVESPRCPPTKHFSAVHSFVPFLRVPALGFGGELNGRALSCVVACASNGAGASSCMNEEASGKPPVNHHPNGAASHQLEA